MKFTIMKCNLRGTHIRRSQRLPNIYHSTTVFGFPTILINDSYFSFTRYIVH